MMRSRNNRIGKSIVNKSIIKKSMGGLAVLTGFGALMYLKNRMVPKYADDYAFSFIWDGKHHGNLAYGEQEYKRVKNLKDLVKSQVSHYMTWSGRTIAETMNQIVLMKDDKKLYDAINTAAILAQILLCHAGARGNKYKEAQRARILPSAPLAAFLAAGYWFGSTYPIHTMFWTTGAANYSWPGILQSAFLLPYSRRFHDDTYKANGPLMALMGLLAGWSNEAGGGIALLLSGTSCIRSKKRGSDTGWMVWGFAGALAGYALLMLSPGNFSRIKLEKEYSDIIPEDFNGLGNVPSKYLYTRRMFLSHLKTGFIPTVIRQIPLQIPVLIYLMQKDGRTTVDTEYIASLELAAIGVPLMLMLSPEFPQRAAYATVLFSMTAASYAFERISPSVMETWGGHIRILAAIGGGAFAVNYLSSLIADADLSSEIEEQLQAVRAHKGEDVVTVPAVSVSDFWSGLAMDASLKDDLLQATWLDVNPEDPYNKAVAAYYDAGPFSVEPVEEHPYRKKGSKALKYSIIKPCKSLLGRLARLISRDGYIPV